MTQSTLIGLGVPAIAVALAVGCDREPPRPTATRVRSEPAVAADAAPDDIYARRTTMVERQIVARGITDRRVLDAMRMVPRHEFVPEEVADLSYEDMPLPIGNGQTISQPYVVAAMTELAHVGPSSRVLEIGTGSGYQAAVLAEIVADVYSIEIDATLARRAADTLDRLGYDRIHLRTGDGHAGWPEAAPYDAIVVTAAPPRVPEPLREQLAIGGRMVIPVGGEDQELLVITRTGQSSYTEERVFPVLFVPMTGGEDQAPAYGPSSFQVPTS